MCATNCGGAASLCTVTCAVPEVVPVVAVIVTSPAPTPVTVPAELTVAIDGSLDDQVKAAFFARPPWKYCAANCCVPPAAIVASLGVTTTVFPPLTAAVSGPVGSLDVQPTNPMDSAATSEHTTRLMIRPR